MSKKEPIVIDAKQSQQLLPAIDKQLKDLEKVLTTCLKEKMMKAANEVTAEIKSLQKLKDEMLDFVKED